MEQGFDRIFGRRLAGAHHPVDGDARGQLVGGFVGSQSLRDVSAFIELVGVKARDFGDASRAQLLQQRFGQLVVGLGDDLTGVSIDDIAGQHAAHQIVFRHADVRGARRLDCTGVARGDALVLLDDDRTVFVGDVEARDFAAQPVSHELHLRARVHQTEVVEHEKVRQDRFWVQADGLQQDRHRHLAAAIDAEIKDVLRVEFEVEPRTAVRNDPGGKQQLAAGVCFALVMLEEHAWRTVQLRDDDALGTVNDEGTIVGHERHFAHVDLLLLDFLDRLRLGRLTVVNDHLQLGAHGGRVGQAAHLALPRVERRLGHVEFDELHLDEPVVRHDRERGQESSLQAFGLAFLRRHILLQEGDVRLLLHGQQIRNLENTLAFTEALADSLAFGVAVRGCVLRHRWFSTPSQRATPGLGLALVGDCRSILVSSTRNFEVRWLATTNRWRTTPALHRSPTKPVLCSRIRELF